MEDNVCRICLQASEEEMTSIFDTDETNEIISHKIKSCCGIKTPREADGLPTKICSKCKVFLTIAYKLRQICQNSDAYLRRFKIKDHEIGADDEIQLKKEDVTEKVKNREEKSKYSHLNSKSSLLMIQETNRKLRRSLSAEIETNELGIKTELDIEIGKIQVPAPLMQESKHIFTCDHCDLTFIKKVNLEKHILTKHEKDDVKLRDKKYGICPYCGDSYVQSSLSLHIRRHTGEKPYKCDVCEKSFVELYDLKRHQRTHTGEKPYICETCGKAFSQKSKLSRHTLVHTGERPYKCVHCDRTFVQRNELNRHILGHTGIKPYKCGVCDQRFITGTLLRNHQKSASHIQETQEDRFEKIRVANLSRSYRRGRRKML